MALTRKFLAAMGVEDDKIDEIIAAHTDTVNALKEERDKYKTDAEKLPTVKQELKELKDATAKAGADNNAYKVKYDALKEEFDSYKQTESKKAERNAKTNAYTALLKKAGVSDKRIAAVIKVSDIDKIELDDDGQIKGSEEMEKSIKEEWADFIVSKSERGAQTSTPPSNTGGTTMTKEEILKIKDPAERQAAIAENHELFGF